MFPRTHHPRKQLRALPYGYEQHSTGIFVAGDARGGGRQGLDEVEEGGEVGKDETIERLVGCFGRLQLS